MTASDTENGLALGILLGVAVYLWQGSALLGAVVGVGLGLNALTAVSIGGTIPLLLKGLRADPAIASVPVLTTITDICGFFLVLGLATLALPWLAGSDPAVRAGRVGYSRSTV